MASRPPGQATLTRSFVGGEANFPPSEFLQRIYRHDRGGSGAPQGQWIDTELTMEELVSASPGGGAPRKVIVHCVEAAGRL